MKLFYKAIFEVDAEDQYNIGVSFPALRGCFSAGYSFDDAYAKAQEALSIYCSWLIEDEEEVPEDVPIEVIELEENEQLFFIESDTDLIENVKKIDVTLKIPVRLYEEAEAYQVDYPQVFEDFLQKKIDRVEFGEDNL